MNKDKRFIEETFPIREVSIEGAKEKNIRHGHISTLHIWWARRPLATSRAINFASLIPVPGSEEEKQNIRNLIAELSKWENTNNEYLLDKARKMILHANGGIPTKVLDPFGGGGSIPLEALRLGCETYSNDYNPVAVLIQKCTLDFPQRYNYKVLRKDYAKDRTWLRSQALNILNEDEYVIPLMEDVKYWSNWILQEAKSELKDYYPNDKDNSIPVGYLWARTVPCQNPGCKSEIPLLRQFWLAKRPNKRIALYPQIIDNTVKFKIVGDGYEQIPEDFNPDEGTTSRAVVICPNCGSTISALDLRKQFHEGKNGERLLLTVLHKPGKSGKKYRIATEADFQTFKKAELKLKEIREELFSDWGMDPIPDEPIKRVPVSFGVINVWVYNINDWGSLYNSRQLLSILTFIKKVRQAHSIIYSELKDSEYTSAITSYLGLGIARLVNRTCKNNLWNVLAEKTEQVFLRQAIQMLWDYFEINTIENQGWENQFYYINEVLSNNLLNSIFENTKPATITNGNASTLHYRDNYFDAVFTDPPYYDNVPYSYLSDFFYVWHKRTFAGIFPDLFSTPLSPKKNEIVAYAQSDGDFASGKKYFEDSIKKAFQEFYRVLKPNGIAVIVYAHKSTSGWETIINALLDSGLVISATYPLNTEMEGRMRATDSATLSSSIYIVARKMERYGTGFYNEVKEELKQYLNVKLENLWAEGITGTDFFIAAIGSGIEIFGKYEKVIDYEGNIKRADILLDDVREIVMQYTVKFILHNGFSGQISELSKFYVIWRFSFGEAKADFDEANKLARSVGIDLSQEWGQYGFIKKEKEFIRVLGPHNRKIDDLTDSDELIDVLHHTLLLWEKGTKDEMMQLLATTGFGQNEAFYRVAQAISESLGKLTPDSKEKKLLDGFLGSKERIKSEVVVTPKKRDSQLNLGL